PERDLALGAVDLLHQLLEVGAPHVEEGLLEIEPAEDREDLALLGFALDFDALPGRLGLAALAAARLGLEPSPLVREALPLAREAGHVGGRAGARAGEGA